MGNQLDLPSTTSAELAVDVPRLVQKDTLGGGRFLKTNLCVDEDGTHVVVKQYLKREQTPSLLEHAKSIQEINQRISGFEGLHALPFLDAFETDRAAYLIRQFMYSSVQERVTSQPFLTRIEKHWIAFQMLRALADCHAAGICHGDLKAENVLLTSWNWVILADFAPFKPVYLPADNPADFNFYFSSGKVQSGKIVSRQRCYLAPERFIGGNGREKVQGSDCLTPEMDVFALGCVIAELFLDGKTFLDYSTALLHREGNVCLADLMNGLDPSVGELVVSMTMVNPKDRPTAAGCVQRILASTCPPYFDPLFHNFSKELLTAEHDKRVELFGRRIPELTSCMKNSVSKEGDGDHIPDPRTRERTTCTFSTPQDVSQASSGSIMDEKVVSSGAGPGLTAGGMPPPLNSHTVEWITERKDDGQNVIERVFDTFEERQRRMEAGEYLSFPGASAGKERVQLPSQGGWMWNGPWTLDAGRGDEKGWEYFFEEQNKLDTLNGREDATSRTVTEERESTTRRRIWRRERHRITKFAPEEGTSCRQSSSEKQNKELRCEGMLLLVNLLCSFIRGSRLPESKIKIIELLEMCSAFLDDCSRWQAVIPSLLSLVTDPFACVRAMAIKHLAKVLDTVWTVTPSDARVFPEYIFPSLSMVPQDPDELVRYEYACNLHVLADVSQRILQHLQLSLQMPEAITYGSMSPRGSATAVGINSMDFESEISDLRAKVQEVILDLILNDASTPLIRRGLMQNVGSLSKFFGRKGTNNHLLPLFITFLNDGDWQLRVAFFANIGNIGNRIGRDAVGEFLLPCIEQGFSDPEDTVIHHALLCFSALSTNQWLVRRHVLAMVRKACPLLHSNKHFLRRAAACAIEASSTCLVEPAGMLLPLLMPYLQRAPLDFTAEGILCCLRAPKPVELERKVRGLGWQDRLVSIDAPLLQSQEEGVLQRKSSHRGTDQQANSNDVVERIAAAMRTELPADLPEASFMDSWRPRGLLIANFEEHRGGINKLSVAPDSSFFVSASDDGTAKLWNTSCFESDPSFHSSLTFAPLEGRMLSCAVSEGSPNCLCTSTSSSVIHVWDFTSSSRPRDRISFHEGPIEELITVGPLLLFITQSGYVRAHDLRSGREAWKLRIGPETGSPRSMALDPSSNLWLVNGTRRGHFSLWDVRYQVEVHQWKHPSLQCIESLAVVPNPSDSPCRGRVLAAAGPYEVGRWDVATGKCDSVFQGNLTNRSVDRSLLPTILAVGTEQVSRSGYGFGEETLQHPPQGVPGMRAVVSFSDGTALLAGTDGNIRLWDADEPDHSRLVCGPWTPGERGRNTARSSVTYAPRTYNGVRILQELHDTKTRSLDPAFLTQERSPAHMDCIRDLQIARPGRNVLLSCGRDGTIKCWI